MKGQKIRNVWLSALTLAMSKMHFPSKDQLLAGSAILFVVGTLVYRTLKQETTTESKPANENHDNGIYQIVGEDYYGFVSNDDLDRALQLSHDEAAFKKFVILGLYSGAAVRFKPGETVFLDDLSWGGKVQIRRKGELVSYWTVREAIRK